MAGRAVGATGESPSGSGSAGVPAGAKYRRHGRPARRPVATRNCADAAPTGNPGVAGSQ
jgi:hypothetical protein